MPIAQPGVIATPTSSISHRESAASAHQQPPRLCSMRRHKLMRKYIVVFVPPPSEGSQGLRSSQVKRPAWPVGPLVSTCGVERRAEFSPLGSRASCFLALVSAWGSLEPSRPGGQNAQKREKTGKNWARYGLRSVKEEGAGGVTWEGRWAIPALSRTELSHAYREARRCLRQTLPLFYRCSSAVFPR